MLYSLRYTDDMPDNFAGYARAWFIRIRPAYKDDKGLHEHELEHVRQFWRTLGFHGLLYLVSKKYKLNAEVEAYQEQLKYAPATTNIEHYRKLYAQYISEDYGLDITPAEAEIKLTGG